MSTIPLKERGPWAVGQVEAEPGVRRTASAILVSFACAGCLLLFSPPAEATTVQLPADEDPALWEGPLAVAGLEAGPTRGQAEWVALITGGASWTLQVQDRSGRLHQLAVDRPTTATEREDLLWLALSLLHPAAGGDAWEETPTPPPPGPSMRPVVVVRDEPEPSRPVASPDPPPPTTPSIAREPDAPPPEDPVDPPPLLPEGPAVGRPIDDDLHGESSDDAEPSGEPSEPDATAPPAEPSPALTDPVPSPGDLPPPDPPPADPVPPEDEATVEVERGLFGEPWPAALPRPYFGLGVGLDVPVTSSPTLDVRLEGGIDVRGRVRLGVALAPRSPTVLYAPGTADLMTGGSALAMVGFDVGRERPVWLWAGLGGHWFDLHGDDSRGTISIGGFRMDLGGGAFSRDGGGVATSLGLEVPFKVAEWLSLQPYVLVEAGSYDPDDVRGYARTLVPVAVRFGVKLTTMRHIGAGLPPAGRPRAR